MNLFHYTSNEAFLSIIAKKEIWLSEFTLSNDALEGKWLREVFIQQCKERGLSAYDQSRLLEELDLVSAVFGGAGFCMSQEGDLLSQWRAYASDAAGVSIGFDHDYFDRLGRLRQERNDSFGVATKKVEYDLSKQKELIRSAFDKVVELVSQGAFKTPTIASPETSEEAAKRKKLFMDLSLSFIQFFPLLYSLKNPAFIEEREWRLISYVVRGPNKDFDQISKMDFRPLKDRIVPFNRIQLENLDVPSIIEVVLGPRNVTPVEIVEAALRKYSFANVTVNRSKASYR